MINTKISGGILAMKKLCLSIAAMAVAGSAFAEANKITAVELLPAAGGKQVLQFQLQKPVSVPAAFTINNPPKISLDFLDTENALGRNALSFNQNGIRSLNLVEAKGRTRVVVNLDRMLAYESKVDGNKLLLTMAAQEGVSATDAEGRSPVFASNAPASAAKDAVRDIDFRRGKNGEGRIVIDLTSANAGVDIRQQGRQLLVDIFKTSLQPSLERRMDVSDFNTPVLRVDAFAQGENVRLAIEPKGNWEYSAYQTDNRLIVEVKPVTESSKEDIIKPTYKGEKLSLNFQNVEVRTVLQVIAEFTKKNIVTSDSVNGSLTLRLKDVPWDQALDIILQARGLDKRENGNVMWIAPRDELNSKESELLKSKQQNLELEATRTESFQLKYQRAEDIAKLLTADKQSLLSKRGSAVFDQKTNTLLVNDVASKLEEVRTLINKIDVATRQVSKGSSSP